MKSKLNIMLILVLVLAATKCKNEQPLTEEEKLKKAFTIMVDPAHGGKDIGATSLEGVTEKEIVFSISQKIERLLSEAGYTVQLIRTRDEFKSLFERVQQAEKSGASLHISIHTNNNRNPDSSGFETFYQEKNPKSKTLDSLVHVEFHKINGMKDCGSKNAEFFILKESNIPAILVEAGFLSNAQDADLITDPAFQEKLALTIKNAVDQYYSLGIE